MLRTFLSESERARQELDIQHGVHLDSPKIYRALIDYFDVSELPNEVLFKELTKDQIVKIVLGYDFERRSLITTVILDESILPEEVPQYFEKAIIKFKGQQWEIHNSDHDFPSSPHAHDYQNNYRLHLGTGELYYKRKIISRISKKDLLRLRKRIIEQVPNIQLPLLLV